MYFKSSKLNDINFSSFAHCFNSIVKQKCKTLFSKLVKGYIKNFLKQIFEITAKTFCRKWEGETLPK